MQKSNFMGAEVIYQKAQMIDPDANKACNLGLCLLRQARYTEARSVLDDVVNGRLPGSDDPKARRRAQELLYELELKQPPPELSDIMGLNLDIDLVNGLEQMMNAWAPSRSKRLPIFEEISSFRNQLAC